MSLESLKPRQKHLVFDLVESTGFDVSEWVNSSKNGHKFKANPRFCYEWSFLEPDKIAILNLWYSVMEERDGEISYQANYRGDAEANRLGGGKAKWIERGEKMDGAVRTAAEQGLPIRVIINDGIRREPGNPRAAKSDVTARELDPESWHVREYDERTGAFVLVRGAGDHRYADQFDTQIGEPEAPERREASSFAFMRNPAVRRAALLRARGKCEFCREAGFRMHNGKIYLETHHIVPLGEGGLDILDNVIALCPNDHRRAHFDEDREALREEMTKRVAG